MTWDMLSIVGLAGTFIEMYKPYKKLNFISNKKVDTIYIELYPCSMRLYTAEKIKRVEYMHRCTVWLSGNALAFHL